MDATEPCRGDPRDACRAHRDRRPRPRLEALGGDDAAARRGRQRRRSDDHLAAGVRSTRVATPDASRGGDRCRQSAASRVARLASMRVAYASDGHREVPPPTTRRATPRQALRPAPTRSRVCMRDASPKGCAARNPLSDVAAATPEGTSGRQAAGGIRPRKVAGMRLIRPARRRPRRSSNGGPARTGSAGRRRGRRQTSEGFGPRPGRGARRA